jgi:excisionase family DNA binding protein
MALVTSSAAQPRFYSIDEVANLLGVSPRTVRRWIKDRKLRAHRFGRTVRIAHDDLQDFLSRHEVGRDETRVSICHVVSAR